MQPAGGFGIGDGFAYGHGEGDYVVFDLRFDLMDAGYVDFGAGAEFFGGFFGDHAGFG